MKRYSVIFALIISLIISAHSNDRPNILVIMVDDLGYGDLSCYGATDLQTPHIDQLFSDGMRFNQFYANCPVCSPTRASFLTGLYPDKAGVPGVIRTPQTDRPTNWGNLRNDVPTLPEHFNAAGYDTALIGKWHLGLEEPDQPNDVGFDYFKGFLGDMMDDYYTHLRFGNHYMRENKEPIHPEGHATDLFSDWSIDYIEDHAQSQDPFMLFLAYNAPHTPIQPPQDWLEKIKTRQPDIDNKRAALVALIEHMDHGIGRVIQSLKDTDQWQDTIVVFTSDNGGQGNVGARNLPLRGAKQNMWEGGIRVSTCFTWPKKIKAGTVNDDNISLTMDLWPTLAELVGTRVDKNITIDGRSFAPVLLGQEFKEDPRTLFWVRLEGNRAYGGLAYHAVRQGDYKLLRNTPYEPYQLYKVGTDPSETTEIPKEKAPKIYWNLFESLMVHLNEAGQHPWQQKQLTH